MGFADTQALLCGRRNVAVPIPSSTILGRPTSLKSGGSRPKPRLNRDLNLNLDLNFDTDPLSLSLSLHALLLNFDCETGWTRLGVMARRAGLVILGV
jgi:hypothetical protein